MKGNLLIGCPAAMTAIAALSTMPLASAAPGLLNEPRDLDVAYVNATDEARTMLNAYGSSRHVVVRSRLVEIDKEYAARFIAEALRDTDVLSETFDLTMFPDTPCTLSYVASRSRRPSYRRPEVAPGQASRFVAPEDLVPTGGERVVLDSHCGSNSEVIKVRVRIDTTDGSIRIELSNDRLYQHLAPLKTDGFILAIELDPAPFRSNGPTDIVAQ